MLVMSCRALGGIIEVADIIAINKADGPMAAIASRAKREHENALHYSRQRIEGWAVPVGLYECLRTSWFTGFMGNGSTPPSVYE